MKISILANLQELIGLASNNRLFLFEVADNCYTTQREIDLTTDQLIPEVNYIISDQESMSSLSRFDQSKIHLSDDPTIFGIIDTFYSRRKTEKQEIREFTKILITGGIGDFIALESHMSNEMKEKIETVYVASRVNDSIEDLVRWTMPKATVVKIEADYKTTTFFEKNDLDGDWEDVDDWSILTKFPEIRLGSHRFVGSGILEKSLEKEDYIVICPETNTEKGTGRDFNESDWKAVIHYLNIVEQKGMVVSGERVRIPESDFLIDMSGRTSLRESIDLLKKASGYIGIDSFLSILATQLFDSQDLVIKSINKHYLDHLEIYCAPKKEFDFVCRGFK